MILYLFLLNSFLFKSKIFINGINIEEEQYPKEINHGSLQNDYWSNDKYEYYINITDYELNEENILELYCKEDKNVIEDVKIYALLTNESIDKIEDYTIKPDTKKGEYSYYIKYDSLTKYNYLFIPFRKNLINQKYFIILFVPYQNLSVNKIYFSLSKRIRNIKLVQKDNSMILFSEGLEARNDIHLYYKLEIDKNINLTENNIFFFVDDISIPIFKKDLFSFQTYDNNMFIIEKNKSKISKLYLGVKTVENKFINVFVNLIKNDIYFLQDEFRVNKKLYFEQINCDNDFYIIENYYDLLTDINKYLIINKFYGNYSLQYYNKVKDIINSFIEEKNGIEINDIMNINGRISFYKLRCITPTAFNFEYFSNDSITITLLDGQQYKTYLTPEILREGNVIKLSTWETIKKYKLYISLLGNNIDVNQSFNFTIYKDDKKKIITLNNQTMEYNETLFYGYYNLPNVEFNSYGVFIHYYLASNRLFYNLAEGETMIKEYGLKNFAFKIKKDLSFDYITFEVKSDYLLEAKYELIIIQNENIENNRIIAPLPGIEIPGSFQINLKISNPYNKFDSNKKFNNNTYYYIIMSFGYLNYYIPTYFNIKYNYNKITPLAQMNSELIVLGKQYEIYGDKNYLTKSKILININKCDQSKNYLFVNYYENKNNIIYKNNIGKNRENILINNIYYNSKIKILTEDIDNDTDNEKNKPFYPADYYNNGDVFFNYFLTNEKFYNDIEITNNFSINYEDIMRSKTKLYWNKYINNKNNINIATIYNIYILPEDSVINSMCQLSLIPSNYSIMNTSEIELEIEEGKYKVMIIASVLDKEFPITNMYDQLNLKVSKRINIILVIVLSILGLLLILVILFILLRKKKRFICFKRPASLFSKKIEENKILTKTKSNNTKKSKTDKKSKNKKKKNKKINKLSENLIDNKIEMDDKIINNNDSFDDKNNEDNENNE